jgi:HSP20 family protein
MTGNGRARGATALDLELLNNRLSTLFVGNGHGAGAAGWTPAVTLQESDAGMVLTVELPGMTEEEIDVQIEGQTLIVQGQKCEPEGEAGRYHLRERAFGSFQRAFRLPGYVEADRISAQLANGVLSLTLPKAETAKPRRIGIGSARRQD